MGPEFLSIPRTLLTRPSRTRRAPSRLRAALRRSVASVCVGCSHPLRLRQGWNARRSHPKSATTRSEEHTSELQSLMRISYAVFCLKKKTNKIEQPKQANIYTTNTQN